jgi:glycosyltransferase involved in cell wall biosynthesis
MKRKKRILFVTESSQLASGFGTYGKEVVARIFNTGKYEVAEFCSYGRSDQFGNVPWIVYGAAPLDNEDEYNNLHAQPQVQWGTLRFESACLDFKPDIVVCYRDPWMDAYIADSPFLPFFHWVWMPTIDSTPQKPEWIYEYFNRCDNLLAYSEFGIKTLQEQTNGRIVPIGCASPAIDPEVFQIINNKEKHKESFGLEPDSIIMGTVMRNQKRKMFPELMKAFRDYLDQVSSDIAAKSYLYFHTAYPEKMGWKISELIHEYKIGSNILSTYVCKACRKFFISVYRDAITTCNHCGQHAATLPNVGPQSIPHADLAKIYNMMDLYVQYAICEGFGMPSCESAACGVPIVAVDYSAMEDVTSHVGGFKIKPHLMREFETNAERSCQNNEQLTQIMVSFAKNKYRMPDKHNQLRLKTRQKCIERYTWDSTAKVWEEYFDNIELSNEPWDAPKKFNPHPTEIPSNLNNQQFCEWLFNVVVQDPYHLFNYRFLTELRSLNFGADMMTGLSQCNPETMFNKYKSVAQRRIYYDALRSGHAPNNPQKFIVEAHKGKH